MQVLFKKRVSYRIQCHCITFVKKKWWWWVFLVGVKIVMMGFPCRIENCDDGFSLSEWKWWWRVFLVGAKMVMMCFPCWSENGDDGFSLSEWKLWWWVFLVEVKMVMMSFPYLSENCDDGFSLSEWKLWWWVFSEWKWWWWVFLVGVKIAKNNFLQSSTVTSERIKKNFQYNDKRPVCNDIPYDKTTKLFTYPTINCKTSSEHKCNIIKHFKSCSVVNNKQAANDNKTCSISNKSFLKNSNRSSR